MEEIKNIPQEELRDEALNEASGGVQATVIYCDSYKDDFGNKYVRDENGNFQRANQMNQAPKRTPYL